MPKVIFSSFISLFVFVFYCPAQTWQFVGSPNFTDSGCYRTIITTDTGGTPYVAFEDATAGNRASVMEYNGSSWVSVGMRGCSPAEVVEGYHWFALSRGIIPYVCYIDVDSGLEVQQYTGTAWVNVGPRTQLDTVVAGYPSIAIDANGVPYIVFMESGYVTVMKFDGSNWSYVGSPWYAPFSANNMDIAIGKNDTPYVAYGDSAGYSSVRKYNGSNWVYVGSPNFSAETLNNIVLAVDTAAGTPYVALVDNYTGNKATVMKYSGSSWAYAGTEGFSLGPVGDIDITISGDGTPYVTYADDAFIWKTTVMKYHDTGWVVVGAEGFSLGITQTESISIDKNGIAYVAYSDNSYNYGAVVQKFVPATEVKDANEANAGLTIFPNPSRGSFTINISSPQKEMATIIITNMLGEKVKELSAATNEDMQLMIDVPGMYFISAKTGIGITSRKMVVQ